MKQFEIVNFFIFVLTMCKLKAIKGDLIKLAQSGKFDMIVHGANCQKVMGGGIALTIKKTFPEAYAVDKKTRKGKSKLGKFSEAIIKKGESGNKKRLIVVNAYTQISPGPPKRTENRVEAITSAFKLLAKKYKDKKLSIGIPLIGAGLAGGDWDEIEPAICEASEGLDVTLVRYVPTRKTYCSLCRALGVNARTCPKNPKAKNPKPDKHLDVTVKVCRKRARKKSRG